MMNKASLLNRLLQVALISCCALFTLPGKAETIQIPVGSQGHEQAIEKPLTGTKKNTVLEQFGEPLERTNAVGEPPISRWEYTNFYVYFEYDHVIHSVTKHRPIK